MSTSALMFDMNVCFFLEFFILIHQTIENIKKY